MAKASDAGAGGSGRPIPLADTPELGTPGEPVRALAFAAGVFDTAMQLGTVHALLVSRSRPPDVVVGVSAGAVNAAALAEVFQARPESPPDVGEHPQEAIDAARLARFRRVLEACRAFPADLLHTLRPDTSQIDVQRPLEPLRLPIHHQLEWDGRLGQVRAGAGFLNLYNELLDVRLSIGTITRVVRRALGIKSVGEAKSRTVRWVSGAAEWFRTWALLGRNLLRAAPIARRLVWAAVWPRARDERGASAAALIFRSRFWSAGARLLKDALAFVILLSVWVLASAIALAVVGVVGWGVIAGVAVLGRVVGIAVPSVVGVGRAAIGLVIGLLLMAIVFAELARKEVGRRTFLGILWSIVQFVLLAVVWGAVFVAVLTAMVGVVAAAAVTVTGLEGWAGHWRDALRPGVTFPWVATGVALIVLAVASVGVVLRHRRRIGINLLRRYRLDAALFDPHPVRRFLVDLFDPEYYGPLDMTSVVERALRDDLRPTSGPRDEKVLRGYALGVPSIHVAVTAANVATGQLVTLPDDIRVVDGLVAALSRVPILPPYAIDGTVYVDGGNVANEPTRALLNYVRQHVPRGDREPSALHLYVVAPHPYSEPTLGPDPDHGTDEYTALIDIAVRSLRLRRFRDATLERRLTEMHSRCMPPGGVLYEAQKDGHTKQYVRSWVYPIEPEAPSDVNRRVLRAARPADQRRVIAETVADGCKAALEQMIRPEIVRARATLDASAAIQISHCRQAIAFRLGGTPEMTSIAQSAAKRGPGVSEVCRHCYFYRAAADETAEAVPRRFAALKTGEKAAPPWPLEDRSTAAGNGGADGQGTPETIPGGMIPAPAETTQSRKVLRTALETHVRATGGTWPRTRSGRKGRERPTVSLVFSGGVFRGVFQVGVLNALSEVGLRPDVIAGASVGSITAAMVARTFMLGEQAKDAVEAEDRMRVALEARQRRIGELAGTYLAIDRLILTDRFANFVRGMTVRAAEARFSIRQLDRVLRRFDQTSSRRFNRDLRTVVAGIERLTWVSPFELLALVRAVRLQQSNRLERLVRSYFQEVLDRMAVGNQVLGADPLERLIRAWVLDGLGDDRDASRLVPFDHFLRNAGIFFLATATNLTRGRLETLGARENPEEPETCATLLEGLLASSAFPGVFRPRWSWEVKPYAPGDEQYVDGGVMDNLPFDAVAEFLHHASHERLVARRPVSGGRPIPHLVFAASLEVDPPHLEGASLDGLRHNWWAMFHRAQQLGYNQKLTIYRRAQRALRAFDRQSPYPPFVPNADLVPPAPGAGAQRYTPLDVEVVTVKPRWLCGTFAFHPMLGFRKEEQARSIAHGCASTLIQLARFRDAPDPLESDPAAAHEEWIQVWGVADGTLPPRSVAERDDPFEPCRTDPGNCWFRPGVVCPFATANARARGLPEQTARAVGRIYEVCGQRPTHRSRSTG